jgi:hypothetical protein
MTLISVDINLRLNVYSKEKYFPLTGTFSIEEGVSGFITNRTKPLNPELNRNDIKTNIGGFKYNLIEGTLKNQWDGGVISGCEYVECLTEKNKWTPILNTGDYTVYEGNKHFFSDNSVSEIIENEEITLDQTGVSTIQIAYYKRDNEFNNIPFIKYEFVDGDFTKSKQYQIEDLENQTKIILSDLNEINIDLLESIENKSYEDLLKYSENKGKSVKDSSRTIYTNYFPVKPDSLKLYSYSNIDEQIDEWELVEDIFNLDQIDSENNLRKCFDIDYSKGIIRTSGYSIDKKYFVLSYSDSNRSFYLSDINNNWPKRGSFSFYNKNNNSFVAKATYEGRYENILQQIKVTLNPHNFSLNQLKQNCYVKLNNTGYQAIENNGNQEFEFFITYSALPLLEYEVLNDQTKLVRKDKTLNLKPIYLNRNNGIIQISPSEKHVSYIKLVCDKERISKDFYGPLLFGIDQTRLTATCYNSSNQAVEGIQVEFKNIINDPYIYFEGLSKLPITKISNRFGDAFVNANVPYDESLMMVISKETSGKSILFNQPEILRNLQDITIFQTLRYNGIEKIINVPEYLALIEQDTDGEYPPLVDRLVYYWNDTLKKYTKITAKQFVDGELLLDVNQNIPECFEQEDTSLVYQYKIFFSRIARIQCTCVDPATGNTIYSNIIDIKLDLPVHLKGVNSLNIPYGFGIKKSEDDFDVNGDNLRFLGTGLGGANFLTINPNVENILNLKLQ